MKKDLVSILITNYNKEKFLKKSIASCLNQNYKKKEVIVLDDFSTDSSKKILKKIKSQNLKIIYNKKQKYKSGPLNQLSSIKSLFKISKGKVIFLLDSDDFFLKSKVNFIQNKFKKDKKLNFIQDRPYLSQKKSSIKLKDKNHLCSIWPSFYPTSCITVRRDFFKNFLKLSYSHQFSNLEIDARLCIYAFLNHEFKTINKIFTVYNYDQYGITSKYKKFGTNWWKKRNEAFDYMKILMKKMNMKFIPSFDYYFTKSINFFIKNY